MMKNPATLMPFAALLRVTLNVMHRGYARPKKNKLNIYSAIIIGALAVRLAWN